MSINLTIVDDEMSILKVLERYFQKSGKYSVKTYSNPLTAINAIKSNAPDIILMDIMMPQINGLDALDQIIEHNPKQKIIMMTAFSTLDKVLAAHKKGAIDYIMKPFKSMADIDRKIEELLT